MSRPLRDDSSAGRIREFFRRNPDEALTVRDAAVKFDMPLQTAKSALRFERQNGRLVKIEKHCGWYQLPER